MVYTISDELWNDDSHDVEEAAMYLEGTGVGWQDLVPCVRADLETHWPQVVGLAEALLQRQRLTGHKAMAVIVGANDRSFTGVG
jgi:hypothetical protein